jgi:hypothetical protein
LRSHQLQITLLLIYTLYKSLQHMLNLLSVLRLNQSLPGNGSQQCLLLCSRPYQLATSHSSLMMAPLDFQAMAVHSLAITGCQLPIWPGYIASARTLQRTPFLKMSLIVVAPLPSNGLGTVTCLPRCCLITDHVITSHYVSWCTMEDG